MLWDSLPKWVRANRFYHSKTVAEGKFDSNNPQAFEQSAKDKKLASIADANLVSSRAVVRNGKAYHYPLLDIDFPVERIPSSHEGHYHLYFNKLLTWEDYHKVLTVLAEVGIIQQGVLKAAEISEETCLRLPWIKKPELNQEPDSTNDW